MYVWLAKWVPIAISLTYVDVAINAFVHLSHLRVVRKLFVWSRHNPCDVNCLEGHFLEGSFIRGRANKKLPKRGLANNEKMTTKLKNDILVKTLQNDWKKRQKWWWDGSKITKVVLTIKKIQNKRNGFLLEGRRASSPKRLLPSLKLVASLKFSKTKQKKE